MLRAVIFDMDGVIVDSEPVHMEAERQTLSPYGIFLSDADLQNYMGRSTRYLLQDVVEKFDLNVTADELYPKHMCRLRRLYRESVDAIPGALALIDELKKQEIDLALASSSDKSLIDSVVDKFHLASSFHTIVSGEEVVRTKPDPEIFLETLNRLHRHPQECVVIEDSCAGVRASRAAGIPCVGFLSPHSGNQDLSEATAVVESLNIINAEWLHRLIESA